nr:glycosyltransferase [Methanosarcina sp. KYL-1]
MFVYGGECVDRGSCRIAVVIPAYNREFYIGSLVLLAKKYAGLVIVVDAGSFDWTAEIAERAGAVVLRGSGRVGALDAWKMGFEAAVDALEGEGVVVAFDADWRHDPAVIPDLAAPVLEGAADLVIGSRWPGSNIGLKIGERHSGFWAFSASAAGLFRFESCGSGPGPGREILGDAERAGLRIQIMGSGGSPGAAGGYVNRLKLGLGLLVVILRGGGEWKPFYHIAVPVFLFELAVLVLSCS